MSNKRYLRFLTAMTAVATAAAIVACGGDPAPGPDPVTPGGTATLAALEVTVANPQLSAKADQSTTLTVIAVDANRRALADVPVALSASSGIVSSGSTTTDTNGRMTATFTLGADRGNRDVTIRALSGNVVGTAGIAVTGTTLTLSASTSTAQTATTPIEITATVADSAKVPLAGAGVNFSTTGGTLSAGSATTDASGLAKVTLTGVTATVRVTATSANAAASVDITASSSTTPSPEPAGVTIRDLTVQVNPSVIAPNTGTSEANFSQIEVRVTGDLGTALGIPVAYAPVRLRIASTPAFGRLSVDTSTSPVLSGTGGQVTARFIAGGATTGTDQVVVCASVDGVTTLPSTSVSQAPCSANERIAKLTISQQPLFIRLSTNNLIEKTNNDLDYIKHFSIYVTDAAGKGVSGVPISVRLKPISFGKGSMAYSEAASQWTFVSRVICPNEDLNFNGVLDSGDSDADMNGKLSPGQSAAFTFPNGTGVTDSSGFVNMSIRFGQAYALWATYEVEARAATAGSERSTSMIYTLSASSDDLGNKDATPGFYLSPFGQATSCSNPN